VGAVIQKRALIVDDSKSARVVLSKMLEKYDLQVHAAESAEDAIAHLQAERPDVIFMDHLMPSMDGFQAVQAIKNDPRTATIPILMYTSQGGELYMGQARALGAIGVLPKQLGLTDVAKVLHQLHLLPERRPDPATDVQQPLALAASPLLPQAPANDAQVEAFAQAEPAAQAPDGSIAPTPAPVVPAAPPISERFIREAVEPLFAAQSAELRRFVLAALDGYRQELGGGTAPPAPVAESPPAEPRSPVLWIAATVLCACAAAGAGYAAWTTRGQLQAAQTELAARVPVAGPAPAVAADPGPAGEARAPDAAAVAKPAPAPVPAPVAAPAAPARQSVPYAYGELPLGAAALDALRAMVDDLTRRGAAGTVHVTSYAADFCLTGNPAEGYVPAPPDMPANRCDVVGNPYDDNLRGAQHQSRAYADYVSTLASTAAGAVAVAVHYVPHAKSRAAYPPAAEALAAAWNQAAVANQVVELRFEPRPPSPAP